MMPLNSVIAVALASVTSYLLGSIPTAVWYGHAFFGIDIRQHGSGNAGATNTFRVLGKRPGTVVLLIDVLKGLTATMLANLLWFIRLIPSDDVPAWKIAFGMIAVVGHLYPVFANFRGGKGVATLLGLILGLYPELALVCVGIFLLVVILSQYVSLGSLLAALAFPVLLLLHVFTPHESTLLIVFGFLVFTLVALTHKKNIARLWRGQESRTVLIRLRRRK
jgi:acyl phosphate:glycerol-3-phosphate acyltransferase